MLPFTLSKLIRSFLLISRRMSFSFLIVKSGFEAARKSNNRMVGLKSPYCPSRLMTSKSTCSINAKRLQLCINLVLRSKHKHSSSINSGLRRKMADNLDPKRDRKVKKNEYLIFKFSSLCIKIVQKENNVD